MARKIRKKQNMIDMLVKEDGYMNDKEMLEDCIAGVTNSLRMNSYHLNATGYIPSSQQLHRVGRIRVLAVKETEESVLDFLFDM